MKHQFTFWISQVLLLAVVGVSAYVSMDTISLIALALIIFSSVCSYIAFSDRRPEERPWYFMLGKMIGLSLVASIVWLLVFVVYGNVLDAYGVILIGFLLAMPLGASSISLLAVLGGLSPFKE